MKVKRETPIPENKIKAVKELIDLMKVKKTVLLVSIKDIPGSQFQEISKKMRKKAIVKVPKKNLIYRAIDESKNESLKEFKNQIKEDFCLLFSDDDSYDLAADLLSKTSPSKAKAGQIALTDIEIPAGPTDLVPGPAISELGAVGIQIQIKDGKIEIKAPKIIAKAGEPISEKATGIMAKLDIKPFKIGFIPVCAYDLKSNKLYLEIKIDQEGALKDLVNNYQKALGFAVNVGYYSDQTIKLMVQKATRQERRLIRVISGEPEEVVQVAEGPKEEKKEEPKVDASAGLASLFG